jgi:hypothetical protein
MLHKKALHLRPTPQMRQFWISVRNKNNPQSNPEHQQSRRLQRIQEFHAPSSIWSAAVLPPLSQL